MNKKIWLALSIIVYCLGTSGLNAQSPLSFQNDYTTVTKSDYVFACMAANGQSRAILEKCACSIDRISELLPYEDYEAAETILSMRLVGGERTAVFRAAGSVNEKVANLKRAQAEAELLCF